jgi:deazaflavin-dependent oxidoreductase (nitroreductase family)
MSDFDNPTDPPGGWQREHLRAYVQSNGAAGHEWRPGVMTLLLTTTGRRSGQTHRTPLIYGVDGDRYVVVASKGGSDTHPMWYLNLEANPAVRVQVADAIFDARARTASEEERSQLWPLMTDVWPLYDEYQDRTSREIPLVILEPMR